VALVTGAASGIGRATALTLADHGATLVCSDLNVAGAEEVAATISAAGGAAWPLCLDVTSEGDWSRALEQVREKHQQLDIVVNCAGIAFASPVADMTLEACLLFDNGDTA
jgi:NAD(P)-dependent dehydrogenase (short-subunit alcohol dehydrogenase family)